MVMEKITVRKNIIAKKINRSEHDKSQFDREFWKNAGHEARFSAAWEMVNEVRLFKGQKDVGESRLQRSIEHVIRRTEGK
jgi:hypothetical protein